MRDRLNILSSKGFVLGLLLLLLNDLYLKTCIGNELTGKLSDFSGLFVFYLFLGVLLPRRPVLTGCIAVAVFLYWKLPVSNSLIAALNGMGFPAARTIDYTDLIALIMIPVASYYRASDYQTWKVQPRILALFSVFAFCATTVAPKTKAKYANINKVYTFPYSRGELINRLNHLAIKELKSASAWPGVQYNSGGNFFYSMYTGDTFGVLMDLNQVTESDTIRYTVKMVDIRIMGDSASSALELISAYKIVNRYSPGDYRKKVIRQFEKRVIRKLNR